MKLQWNDERYFSLRDQVRRLKIKTRILDCLATYVTVKDDNFITNEKLQGNQGVVVSAGVENTMDKACDEGG